MWIMDDDDDEITVVIPRRILVAEDDEEMRAMVAAWLRREGYEVVEAREGRELLEKLDRGTQHHRGFDLVISDVRMPGLDGVEMMKRLRARGNRTPVLLMSAFADPALHAYALASGATAFIDKPFEMYDLCTAAKYWASQGVEG